MRLDCKFQIKVKLTELCMKVCVEVINRHSNRVVPEHEKAAKETITEAALASTVHSSTVTFHQEPSAGSKVLLMVQFVVFNHRHTNTIFISVNFVEKQPN